MRVLVMEPGKEAVDKEIDSSLKSMQKVVGGYIEAIYPFRDPVALVCNEEGKLDHLPLNRVLYDEDSGQALDVIAGTFFICGAPPDAEDFTSLTDEQVQKYQERFHSPEMIAPTEDGVMVIREMEM